MRRIVVNQEEEDASENIEDNLTAQQISTVPTSAKLQIKVKYS